MRLMVIEAQPGKDRTAVPIHPWSVLPAGSLRDRLKVAGSCVGNEDQKLFSHWPIRAIRLAGAFSFAGASSMVPQRTSPRCIAEGRRRSESGSAGCPCQPADAEWPADTDLLFQNHARQFGHAVQLRGTAG